MEQSFDYQEIMSMGEDAARTLNSPVLMLAYKMTVEAITAEIFKCEPGHVKTLEELRRQGNSLAAVFGRLQSFVHMAESEAAKMQAPNPDAPDEYQGFNLQNVQ